MSIKDLRDVIIERVEVTHQMVTLAKSFILTNFNQFVSTMLEEFQKQQDATLAHPVVLLETDPAQTNTQATNVARFLSWQLAFVEALWALIHVGTLLPYKDSTQPTITTVDYAETRNRGSWTFDEFRYEGVFAYPPRKGIFQQFGLDAYLNCKKWAGTYCQIGSLPISGVKITDYL